MAQITLEETRRIKRMVRQNIPVTTIAEEVGYSTVSITKLIEKYGWQSYKELFGHGLMEIPLPADEKDKFQRQADLESLSMIEFMIRKVIGPVMLCVADDCEDILMLGSEPGYEKMKLDLTRYGMTNFRNLALTLKICSELKMKLVDRLSVMGDESDFQKEMLRVLKMAESGKMEGYRRDNVLDVQYNDRTEEESARLLEQSLEPKELVEKKSSQKPRIA